MTAPAQQLSYRPRVVLAHRILERLVEQVGVTFPVPGPDEGRLQGRARWFDCGDGEAELMAAGTMRRVAVVRFDPPHRPSTAYVSLELGAGRTLEADVAIGEALVVDIFGTEAP